MVESIADAAELEDSGVLDPADSLEGDDLLADPLDAGVEPPDRWSAGEGYGTTLAEERAGESLDQHLAEEQPDVVAPVDDLDWRADGIGEDGRSILSRELGIDGSHGCAEESAMHVVDITMSAEAVDPLC